MNRFVLLLSLLPCLAAFDDVGRILKQVRRLETGGCTATLTNGTVLEWAEGESFGNLVTNMCGSPEDFPCYCSAFETDNVVCPYCPFTNNLGETECAESGETLFFLDTESVNQTCTCTYLGNNTIRTFCDPRDVETALPSMSSSATPTGEEPTASPSATPTTSEPTSSPTAAPTKTPCLSYAATCSTSSDCCSSRCVLGKCAKGFPATDKDSNKLVDGRGGVAKQNSQPQQSLVGGRARKLSSDHIPRTVRGM
eukprot:Nitzschia sp. Nitz4//scaffold109_size72162//21311//22069//NITZ4_005840-RA/size72162-processed-gene-0.39-mRNA-1//-1//CDS//3329532745//7044//frame0